jgi:amino acid transporter
MDLSNENKGEEKIYSEAHSDNGQESIECTEARDIPITRGLSWRHAQFIALGGAIGPGLFVSSGKTLATGGPAFLVGSYTFMSALIYLVLVSVTESLLIYHFPEEQ